MYNTPRKIFENRNKLGIRQSIDLLINQIKSSNRVEIRKEAVRYLGEIGDEEYCEIIENILLSDKSDLVRMEAAAALGCFATQKVLKPLKWVSLHEDNIELKKSAIKSIQKICNPNEEISFFTEIIGDPSPDIRKLARESIYKIEPLDRIELLVERLEIKNEAVRIEFLKILNHSFDTLSPSQIVKIPEIIPEYKNKVIGKLIKFLKKSNPQLVEISALILLNLRELAIDDLIFAVEDENYLIRKNVIKIFGNIKNERVVQSLVNKLDDIYNEVNISCIEALGNIGNESVIEPLLKVLDIEDESFEYVDYDLKWYIIESIKNIYINNPSISFDYLYKYIDLDKNIFKENIPIILGEIGNDECTDNLLNLLNDPHIEIRKNVIIALGKIGCKKSVDQLLKILDGDSYWLLKKVSIDAIESICENEIENRSFIDDIVNQFIKFLNDEDFNVRAGAINFLGNFGDGKILKNLLRCVGDYHSKVRLLAIKTIKKIEANIENENNGQH